MSLNVFLINFLEHLLQNIIVNKTKQNKKKKSKGELFEASTAFCPVCCSRALAPSDFLCPNYRTKVH